MISDLLKKIKEAIYGEEVRESICNAIKQCYKDATGHPESVAAVVSDLLIERKRIDNLITSQTFEQAYAQSNLVFHAYQGSATGDPDPDDSYNYEGTSGKHEMPAYKNFTVGTLNFAEKQSNEKIKMVKEGLYIFELRIRTSGTGRLDIEARINNSSQRYNAQLLPVQNIEEVRVLTYILYLHENDIISFYCSPQLGTSARTPVLDVNCYALDWEGKVTNYSNEIIDARIGVDGTGYSNLGEAIRVQVKEIERRIDLTGVPRNLLKKYYTVNEGGGITAKMSGHDYSITGKGTDYSDVVVIGERLDDSKLEAGGVYYVYGYPDGMFVAIETEAGAIQSVEINKKHLLALPEDAVSFRFVMHTFTDTTYNYSGTLCVYDEPLENTLQSQIYDLNEKIDAMQEIITKIVTSPQLIATENGGLQIKYNSEEG